MKSSKQIKKEADANDVKMRKLLFEMSLCHEEKCHLLAELSMAENYKSKQYWSKWLAMRKEHQKRGLRVDDKRKVFNYPKFNADDERTV